MNCYLCLMESRCASRPAFAICQRCGAGMCEKHLVEVKTTPLVGMAGMIYASSQHRLICWNCYHTTSFTTAGHRPRRTIHETGTLKKDKTWWKGWFQRFWLWSRPQSIVSDEEEAVATVEQFLKQQRLR
ncbi:MAG: DUF2180 family protein [Ktedonobacteraceae bacterium]